MDSYSGGPQKQTVKLRETGEGGPNRWQPQLQWSSVNTRVGLRITANDVLLESCNLRAPKQTLKERNNQNNAIQAKSSAYTLEEVVQFSNTRRNTEVDRLITKVHHKAAKQRGVDLHRHVKT